MYNHGVIAIVITLAFYVNGECHDYYNRRTTGIKRITANRCS